MAEERRHGEPVGQTADHAGLSAGLDHDVKNPAREPCGSPQTQRPCRSAWPSREAVAPQPRTPDHIGPVRHDAPLPNAPLHLSPPLAGEGRVGAREGRAGAGSMGSSGFIPNPYPRPGGTGLGVGRWCSRKLPTRRTANFRKAIRNGRSSIPGKSSTLAREQADMIPVAYIEHQLPGRVRLRVPSRRGEVPFFEKVVRELSKHPQSASSLPRRSREA